MSLLWKKAAAFQIDPRQGMAWHVEPGEENYARSAKHVRDAGFAGHVDHDADTRAEYAGMDEDHDEDKFDEDLYDQAHENVVQSRDQRHYDEHGEFPQSYDDRKDDEYYRLKDQKAREDEPDHEDNALMNFVGNHGTNTAHWHQHGEYGAVNLQQPVYATQSHVSQAHIDKYLHDPNAMSHHRTKYQNAGNSDYLGDGAPMFVTHQGRLHTTEGHHRTAAALQRGDSHIMGWHYDADKHGGFPDEDGNMPGHPDYYDPNEW
jgi:hypothetical protein